MKSEWKLSRQRDFTGGENLKGIPEFLANNQVLAATNCVLTNEGILQTRDGKTQVNLSLISGVTPITSIHRYSRENGSKYLLVQIGTSLYSASWGDGDNYAPSAIKTGLNAAKLRSTVWKDKIIFTNGIDPIFYFNGSTCTNVGGNPPESDIIVNYAGRLWIVDKAYPNVIQFSDLETMDSWDVLNRVQVRDGDGDRITGLCPLSGGMVVFKQNTVWTMYGTNLFNLQIPDAPIAAHVGCVATDSIIADGVFLGKDNLYRFDLTSVTPFPETHTPLIQGLSLAQKQAAFGIAHPLEKRALMVIGDNILCIDAKFNGAITTWNGLNASCFCVADDRNDFGSLLMGDATTSRVYRYSGTTDDGTDITTVFESPYDDYGLIGRKKVFRKLEIEAQMLDLQGSYGLLGSYDIDYGSASGTLSATGTFTYPNDTEWGQDSWGTQNWGASQPRVDFSFWLNNNNRGDLISFTLTTSDRLKLLGYKTKYREAGAI